MRIEQFISGDAVDSLVDVLLLVGIDGSILDANPAALDCYGYSRAELLALNIRDLRARHDADVVDAEMRQIAEHRLVFESEHRRSDGTQFPVEVRATGVSIEGESAFLGTVRDISESAEAQQLVKVYAELLEVSPAAVTVHSPEGVFLYANERALEMHGFTREEFLGLNLHEVDVPVDAALIEERIREIAEQGETSFEVFHYRKDGSLIPLAVNARLAEWDGREVILSVATDISERRKVQEVLQDRDRWLSESQRIASLGHYIYDIQADHWDGSPTLYDVLGVDESYERDFAGWLALTHPADQDRLSHYFTDDVLGKRLPFDIEYRVVRPRDGVERWVHGVGNVEYLEDGSPAAMFGIIQDITERKHAETALRASEEKFRGLFEGANEGIFLLDSQGAIVSVNAAFAAMHDYTVEELLSMDISELDAPKSARLSPARFKRLLAREPMSFEVEHICKNGVLIPLEVSASRIVVGDETYILAFHRDISERRQAEDALREALASIIDVVGSLSEMRDPYTAGHQRRVAELASAIATEMEMSEADIADIHVAGLMHDIGKMSVPAEILSKPTTLSSIELDLIKGHAEAGYNIIETARMHAPIAELVYQHQERCDGSGYPRGMTSDQLLSGSKVLMVADVVEAMMSHRPYRAALGKDAALAEIEQGAGRLYDSQVAQACIRVFRDRGFEFSEN